MIKNPFRAKPAMPSVTAPVQGELALETVKVVRNDLSDSDLEVVPAVLAVPEPPPKPVAAPEAHAVEGSNWGRITSRLFGAGKI